MGKYTDTSGDNWAYIDTLSGTTWTTTIAPEPANAGTDAAGDQSAWLDGVACTSSTSCLAVGQYETSSGQTMGLIENLSSGSWSAFEPSEPSGTTYSSLTAVACPSSGSCAAIGTYDASGYQYGLLQTGSGTSWTSRAAVVPSGGTNSALSGVACPASGTCFAVGRYDNSSYVEYGLIDADSGGTWSGYQAGTISGYTSYQLVSVSCASTTSCEAVGTDLDSSYYGYGLIEVYSGSEPWSAANASQPTGHGTDAGANESSSLASVSCVSTTTCTAVGQYELATSGYSIAADLDTISIPGPSQSALAAAQPTSTVAYAQLNTIACPSTTSCVTVGIYQDSTSRAQGLLDVLSGGSVTGIEAPSPASPPLDPDLQLLGVSCPVSTGCVAVGSYRDASDEQWGLIEPESSGSYTAISAPEPADAGTDSAGEQKAALQAVSCTSNTSCVAVGWYDNSSGDPEALIETLSGSSWTASTAPEPSVNAGTGSDQTAQLSAVSCTSSTSCVAVGYYESSTGYDWGLVVVLASGTWSAYEAPEPASAGTGVYQYAKLVALSCPAAGSCIAAGQYRDSSYHYWGLVDSGGGSSWTATTAPEPANAGSGSDQGTSPASLACPSSATCVVVGSYTDSSGHTDGLIDVGSVTSWPSSGSSEVAEPSGGGTGSDTYSTVASVSCPSTTSCVAAGTYEDSSGYKWGLVETGSYASSWTWSGAQAAEPSGAAGDGSGQSGSLAVVGCAATTWCVAAGLYKDTNGTTWGDLEVDWSGTWSVEQLPEPSNAGDLSSAINVGVGSLACGGDGGCVLVGDYLDGGPTTEGYIAEQSPPPPTVSAVSPAAGPGDGGATVTVTGTNFFPTPTVSFGGVPAESVTYVSATSLSVLTASGSGTVDVQVTTAGARRRHRAPTTTPTGRAAPGRWPSPRRRSCTGRSSSTATTSGPRPRRRRTPPAASARAGRRPPARAAASR